MATATNPSDQPTLPLPSGGAMPLVGFGTWRAFDSGAYQAVRQALDAGYRHIDTATMYRNEAEIGRAVRDSGVPREDIFITTKLPQDRAGRERATLEESLKALDTQYVDLWLIHWPPDRGAGVPMWRHFLAAQREGQARAVGVSNYSIEQIDELISATSVAPEVNQIPWSPALYDADLLAASRERGVVVEGYSPFRRSDLDDPVLTGVAEAHGVTPAQVVLRWHVQHEVVVIPKSVTPERIASNFDVFGFSLTDEEMHRIDGLAAS